MTVDGRWLTAYGLWLMAYGLGLTVTLPALAHRRTLRYHFNVSTSPPGPSMHRLPASAAALLVLAACAKTINPEPVPVPGVALQTWSVEVREPRARDIYLRNDTDRDVVITSLQLYNCRNIKQDCKAYTPNVTIPAGRTAKAIRVEPFNNKVTWTYNFNYQFRMVGSATASTPDRVAGATQIADVAAFVPAVAATTDGGRCNGGGPTRESDGGSTLIMIFGNSIRPSRIVRVHLDPARRPFEYGDTRGDVTRRPDLSDSTASDRTDIRLQIDRQMTYLINEPKGAPRESYYVGGPVPLSAENLGDPAAMIERIVKECGGK